MPDSLWSANVSRETFAGNEVLYSILIAFEDNLQENGRAAFRQPVFCTNSSPEGRGGFIWTQSQPLPRHTLPAALQ